MLTFKDRCITLRKQDYTLLEIARITGRAKTSVYAHIRNVPLSFHKQHEILQMRRTRAARISALRKGKSTKPFQKITSWTPDTVFLVAHLLFDGEIRRTACIYNNRSKALIRDVANAMKQIYRFEPTRYRNPLTGVLRISYHNVALGEHIQGKSERLLKDILTAPRELKKKFLLAFFDDEGCMDFRPLQNRRSIRGYQKRRGILRIIRALLGNFGIQSSIREPNEVVIAGKENLMRFREHIGFSKGVTVNGQRSNSRWKQNLEKRELLNRSILSFRN